MDFVDTLTQYLSKEEIGDLLKSFDSKDTHAVILNPSKIKKEDFINQHKSLKQHPIVNNAFIFDKSVDELGKEIFYDCGCYSIQDPSAMLPAYFLNPQPNELVLDMCAAPGGKTIQLSLSMQGKGVLIANDLSYQRAKDLSQNIERMGLGNVIVSSTDFSKEYKHYLNSFDKILLDAPCSGSAMFRKNPKAREDWSINKVECCSKIQRNLLDIAFSMLKPGGRMCYSTCSFSYQENDAQILDFLSRHEDAKIVSLPKNDLFIYSPSLPEAIHILPTHFEGEGQFLCIVEKDGQLSSNPFVSKNLKKYEEIIQKYGLTNRSNEIIGESLYSLSNHFDISHLNVLRYGVRVLDINDYGNMHHNLSHFLDSSYSIELNESNMKKYIHGDTFAIDAENGQRVVSYKGVNLGFIKIVNKTAKNHYPKGLRKQII